MEKMVASVRKSLQMFYRHRSQDKTGSKIHQEQCLQDNMVKLYPMLWLMAAQVYQYLKHRLF